MSSTSFTKLFSSITDSSVWQESNETRLVWITMLAMADQFGIVSAAIPGLAHRARVSLKDTEAAIEIFLSPDPYSRTDDNDGRRIEKTTGGWRLLNHSIYREKRSDEERKEQNRLAQERKRKKDKESAIMSAEMMTVSNSQQSQPPSAQAEAYADTDVSTNTLAPSADALVAASSPAVGSIILVDRTQWHFTEEDVRDWKEAFPGVDVLQQLRAYREWAKANPTKRKTRKGIRKSVTSWLSNQQDKTGGPSNVRQDAVLERQRQNLANIEAAARRLESSDGASGGFLSEPDTPAGNSGRLHAGLEADCGQAWPGSVPERPMERSQAFGFLSTTQGDR